MSQYELQRFAAAVQADPALVRCFDTATTPAEGAVRLSRERPDEQLDHVTGSGLLIGGLVLIGIGLAVGTAAIPDAVDRAKGRP